MCVIVYFFALNIRTEYLMYTPVLVLYGMDYLYKYDNQKALIFLAQFEDSPFKEMLYLICIPF